MNEFDRLVAGIESGQPDSLVDEIPAAAPGEAAAVAVAVPARADRLTLRSRGVLTKGIRKRRSVPIVGYVGLNGSFKSATMVRDTIPSLILGRRVLSTVEILDAHSGNPHPLYIPFTSWAQLHDFRDGDLLLDEVTGIMDSRDQGMPKHVRRKLPQMRRSNVLIRWTGIDWDNSDKRLRQVTQAAARCRGFVASSANLRGETEDALPMWAPRRLAYVVTYDAQTLNAAADTSALSEDLAKKKRARVKNREWWWGPGSLAFRSYNTLADVEQVTADCAICGGRVPEVTCKQPDEHRMMVAAIATSSGVSVA
jgi:hypothetical protein